MSEHTTCQRPIRIPSFKEAHNPSITKLLRKFYCICREAGKEVGWHRDAVTLHSGRFMFTCIKSRAHKNRWFPWRFMIGEEGAVVEEEVAGTIEEGAVVGGVEGPEFGNGGEGAEVGVVYELVVGVGKVERRVFDGFDIAGFAREGIDIMK